MVRTKPNQKVQIDQLKLLDEQLGNLPEKPKEELTLRESIYFLRDKLKRALKKGYSYQDLSEILSEQKISISAATLKQYLTEIKKKSSSRKRSKAGSKQSPKDLNKIESESVKELEQQKSSNDTDSSKLKLSDNSQQESKQPQPKTRKSVKDKSKDSLGANQDLSSEFNQY